MVKPDYKGIIAEGKGQGAKETKTTVENERPYTKFYNDILEELIKAKIRIEAEHTYLAIMRKTTGFNKETDRIPLSQLQQLTGLSKRNVIRALDDLIKRNMIIKTKTDGFHCSYTLTDVNNWIKRVSPMTPNGGTGDTLNGVIMYKQYDLYDTQNGVTRATLKRKEIHYSKETRAREGQEFCKITTKGLTKGEILRHGMKNNCFERGKECQEDCDVWGRLHLIKINWILNGQ